jgi:hypothetical protein
MQDLGFVNLLQVNMITRQEGIGRPLGSALMRRWEGR